MPHGMLGSEKDEEFDASEVTTATDMIKYFCVISTVSRRSDQDSHATIPSIFQIGEWEVEIWQRGR